MKGKLLSVSVITPVFNGAGYLGALIESVQSQNYPYLEYIVVDDGSTDGGATISVLKKYPHLRWWSRDNRGQYETMNEGLKAATGEVVCFISADDLMTPDSIWKAVNFLASHDGFAGVYGNYKFVNSEGAALNHFHPMRHMPTVAYPYSLHIAHSSLYLMRSVLMENSLFFDSRLHYVGDYEWIIRILRSGYKIGRIKENLSLIRLHEQQASKVSFYKMREETRNLQKKLGISLFWSSVLRKVMFTTETVNTMKSKGLQAGLNIILDRLKNSREKYENRFD